MTKLGSVATKTLFNLEMLMTLSDVFITMKNTTQAISELSMAPDMARYLIAVAVTDTGSRPLQPYMTLLK